eukprot:Pgem_evm2s3590
MDWISWITYFSITEEDFKVSVNKIQVKDNCESWEKAGFKVTKNTNSKEGGIVRIGNIDIELLGSNENLGQGITGWSLFKSAKEKNEIIKKQVCLDGLKTEVSGTTESFCSLDKYDQHPNGAFLIDHVS